MRNTTGLTHECSPEIFPQRDEVGDVADADTYPHMEPDVETNSEQPNNNSTNPRSSKYNLRHITRSLIAVTITDTSSSAEQMCSTERARSRSKNSTKALRCAYVAVHMSRIFYSVYSLATNSLATQSRLLRKHGH